VNCLKRYTDGKPSYIIPLTINYTFASVEGVSTGRNERLVTFDALVTLGAPLKKSAPFSAA